MYKEIYSKKDNILFKVFLIVVFALLLFSVPSYIDMRNYAVMFETTVFAGMLIMIAVILWHHHNDYRYQIIDGRFIAKAKKGKRETVLLDIDMGSILSIDKCNCKDIKKYRIFNTLYLCSGFRKKDMYAVIYKEKNRLKKFYFMPSEKLIELIKDNIKKVSD